MLPPARFFCRFLNLFFVVTLFCLTILTSFAQTYSVSGTVLYYDNQSPAVNQPVTFTVVGTSRPFRQTQNLRLSSTGTYTLSSLPAGTYQIYLRDQLSAPNTPRWLRTSASVTFTQSNLTQFNLTAIRGDITGNNKIDVDDLFELLLGFGSVKGDGSGTYEQYPDGDIDGNNKIDVDDLFILLSNFNVNGDEIPIISSVSAPGWAMGSQPSHSTADSGGSGPSSAGSVNPATGVYENTPDPDIAVRNPKGPSISFSRFYDSLQAAWGQGSPGLTPGWTHNYDLTIRTTTDAGIWGNLVLVYPNGGSDQWRVIITANNPSGITPPTGVPYIVTGGSPSGTVGIWSSFEIEFTDETRWQFSPATNDPTLYIPTKITDSVNRSLTLLYDATNHLVSINNSDGILLKLEYQNAGNTLSTARDIPGSRSVDYSVSGGNLSAVSCIHSSSSSSSAKWKYLYTPVSTSAGNWTLLSQVGIQSPDGSGGVVYHAPLTYDVGGRVANHVDANGNQHSYDYSDNYTTITSGSPNSSDTPEVWTQYFSSLTHVNTGTKDANGATETVSYNSYFSDYLPVGFVNANGQTSSIYYDNLGRVNSTSESVNNVSETDNKISTIYYNYDSNNTFHLLAVGQTISSVYGMYYNFLGGRTFAEYTYKSGTGLIETITTPAPSGSITSGNATKVKTTYTYTTLGNVKQITVPSPGTSPTANYLFEYQHDVIYGTTTDVPEALGAPLKITDPNGFTTHYRYDARGNIIKFYDEEGIETDYQYNDADQLTKITYTKSSYDYSVKSQAHTDYKYAYPGGDLLSVSIFDESGSTTPFRTVTNTPGNEAEIKSVTGNTPTVKTKFDPQYRLKEVQDGQNPATTFKYDNVGNPVKMTYPGGKSVASGFDLKGNPTSSTNARNQKTQFTLATEVKGDNRLKSVTYPAGTLPNVTYEYDDYGRVTKISDLTRDQNNKVISGVCELTYTYDDLDNLTLETTYYPGWGNGDTFNRAYDYYPDGSVKSTNLYTNSRNYSTLFTYLYDAGGRLTNKGNYQTFSYYRNGWLKTQRNNYYLDTTSDTYTRNNRGQITDLNSSGLHYQNFKYDGAGNLLSYDKSDYQGIPYNGFLYNYSFTYDSDDRLKTESLNYNPYSNLYAYDDADNLITIRGNSLGTPNADNQLPAPNFSYDDDGNTLTEPDTMLGFDLENRLTSWAASDPDNPTSGAVQRKFVYRPDGLRAYTEYPNHTRNYFFYEGDRIILEDQSLYPNYTAHLFITWNWGVAGLMERVGGGYAFGYSFDPLGNKAYFGSNISEKVGYDAYGRLYTGNPNSTSYNGQPDLSDPIGFAGQFGAYTEATYTDKTPHQSGLVWMTHRGYNPRTGRFLSRDPIGYEGGINLYAYAGNNPVTHADPSGLDWFDNFSNFLAGAGDSLTLGLTSGVRSVGNRIFTGSWDDLTDHESGWYSAGEWTETGVEIALTLGSSALKKAAAKKADSVARREMQQTLVKIYGRDNIPKGIKHHLHPLSGHPVNITKGKVIHTEFPTRGLSGVWHSGKLNLKIFPDTVAGKAAHMAAHRKLIKQEKIYRAIINPHATTFRAGRNLLTRQH